MKRYLGQSPGLFLVVSALCADFEPPARRYSKFERGHTSKLHFVEKAAYVVFQ